MTAIEIGGLILISYLAVFGIVNRICKCIEHCATGKAIRETAVVANGKEAVNKEAGDVEKIEK